MGPACDSAVSRYVFYRLIFFMILAFFPFHQNQPLLDDNAQHQQRCIFLLYAIHIAVFMQQAPDSQQLQTDKSLDLPDITAPRSRVPRLLLA